MAHLSRRRVMTSGAAAAGMVLSRLPDGRAADSTRPDLPIPAELRPDASGRISVAARTGRLAVLPGRATPTYGYNAPFLGPALRFRRGESVHVDFANHLPEVTTVHWHGLIIPGDVDGGPHQPVPPGQHWRPTLAIDQPAATLWFHPHFYPTTAAQVTRGLAGLLIIDDEDADRLPLPRRWGIDDIPLIIQDRRFDADGRFFHRMNVTAVTSGFVGDVPLVNGTHYPVARTARGWLRLRILDGSNARSYRLAASDGRSLFVIGSDGGLLANPVTMTEIAVHAGERFEIMVDCRSGKPFDLVTRPVDPPIMRLPPFDRDVPLVTIQPDGAEGPATLPERLADLPAIPAGLPPVSQQLVMNMFDDKAGMMPLMKAGLVAMAKSGKTDPAVVARVTALITDAPPLPLAEQLSANGVNGRPFTVGEPDFSAMRNRLLRWRIAENTDQMLHPVHIHGCQFRILSESGKPPQPYRAGWKDVAPIERGGVSDILLRFPHRANTQGPYMAHCHILEHEDSGMMTQFVVG